MNCSKSNQKYIYFVYLNLLIEFAYQKLESFDSNILQQLFDYEICFVFSQHEIIDLKGEFILKTGFKRLFERFLTRKINQICMTHPINKHFRLKNCIFYNYQLHLLNQN